MSVKLRKKTSKTSDNISLYLDIYSNGQRKYEFLKLYLFKKTTTTQQREHNKQNLTLAESIRAKRELELNSSRYNFEADFKLKTDFFEFCNSFLNKYTDKSIYRDYKSVIQYFKEHLGKDTIQIGNIDKTTIENFKDFLFNSGLHQNTVFTYFARIKTIFAEAEKKGIILNNPTKHVSNVKRIDTHKEFLTTAEIHLLANTDTKYKNVKHAFLFATYTGLRHIDILNLTWANIVKRELNGIEHTFVEITQQKTKQNIKIRLNIVAIKLIGETQSPDKPIFKIPKEVGQTNEYLKQWAKEAGLSKDITFHVARHSFATNLLTNKTDIYTVSKLLGHTSLKHTQIYAKIVDSLMNEATANLPEIEFEM